LTTFVVFRNGMIDNTDKHTHTYTHTHPTYTSTIFYTHSLLRAESPGGCAVAECSPSVCTGVPLVCVCEQIGTCRGRRAPPRHRWAYLCARRVAHARRSVRRRRRRPRHTHTGPRSGRRRRDQCDQSPHQYRIFSATLRRARHTPLFSLFRLFRLFYFILSPFVSRFLSTHANPTASPRTHTETHRHTPQTHQQTQTTSSVVRRQRPRPRDTGQVLYRGTLQQ